MKDFYNKIQACTNQNRMVALATIIKGQGLGSKLLIYKDGLFEGDLGDSTLNDQVAILASQVFNSQEPKRVDLTFRNEIIELFIDVFPPLPKLIIIGAVHIAIPLVTMGKIAGYHTIVIDPRRAFAMRDKFNYAEELIVEWPTDALERVGIDEATCFVTLTHDEKIDNPSLAYALKSSARYIGALGSPKTHAKRKTALVEMGFTEEELQKIHSPIGLDIGARGPHEIAISIIAEIVAQKHGKL